MFSMTGVLRLSVWVCVWVSFSTNEVVKVYRVFVPRQHFLFLSCDGQLDVQWRRGSENLINGNSTKQKVLRNGTLYISEVEPSDAGFYYCNQRVIAHVTVLTGLEAVVCEGGTVYLRCTLPKQRWAFKQVTESRRQFISTRYKNGTVIRERLDPHSRFTHTSDHLQIQNIQQLDSGTYYCSGKEVVVLTVTTERNTHQCPTSDTKTRSDVPQKPGNVVLVVVLALCVLTVVTVVLLSVIVCLKFSGRRKPAASKPEESVLSVQTTHTDDTAAVTLHSANQLRCYNEEIHYASLGKQNWKTGGWNQQTKQQVIYSTLLLKPKPTHTP